MRIQFMLLGGWDELVPCTNYRDLSYRPVRRWLSMAGQHMFINSTYLSSTLEELLSRKCSCSLGARMRDWNEEGVGRGVLVDEVLCAGLDALALDARHRLIRHFSRQERIPPRSI